MQLSPLLYNVYTDDLNHHLRATGVMCYVGGANVNSLICANDMVLLASTVLAPACTRPFLEVCRAYAGPHDRMCTSQRKQYVCWFDQSNHRVGTEQESCSEMRNLALSRSFVDCKLSRCIRQNAVGNMLVRKFSIALVEAKIQLFKSY